MFHGIVASCDVAKGHHILEERIIASFADFGESIKPSFSDHVPASIDCAVIFIVLT
jgi:hypothetical protein